MSVTDHPCRAVAAQYARGRSNRPYLPSCMVNPQPMLPGADRLDAVTAVLVYKDGRSATGRAATNQQIGAISNWPNVMLSV